MLRLNWYLQITWTNTKETRHFTISKTETAQRSKKFRQYRKVKVEEPWKIRSYQPDPRVPFTHAPYLQFSTFFGRSPRKKLSKTDESFQGWAPSWRIFQKFWVFSIFLFSKWRGVDDIIYIYICYGVLGKVSKFWRPYKSFFFGLWRNYEGWPTMSLFPMFWGAKLLDTHIPSWELTYHTLVKGKSSSKEPQNGIC